MDSPPQSPNTSSGSPGRKRRPNPDTWMRNILKKARIEGRETTTYITKRNPVAKVVKARVQTKEFKCRCKCAQKFSEKAKEQIFKRYAQFSSHSEQNLYLQSCTRPKAVARRRKRIKEEGGGKDRSVTFEYTLEIQSGKRSKAIIVCQRAFLSLLGIKQSRLRHKVQNDRSTHSDRRGKHTNRPNKTPDDVLEKVRNFIKNLPARESHYSRQKQTTGRKFLDSNVTIKGLHDTFSSQHPECVSTMSYNRFSQIFNTEFNIGIGFPRTDICDTCEKLNAQLKVAETKGNKRRMKKLQEDIDDHHAQAEAFNTKRQEIVKSIANDPTQTAICFDYQKNLPLPVTNVSQEYYKSQLWVHNFCIQDMKSRQSTMFLYPEHYADKGPNEVISMLDWYIAYELAPEIKQLHIFSDNCVGQNKNRFVWAYFQSTVDSGRLDAVIISYPIPGHSFLPCDRDFAMIEKKRKRCDRILVPSFWVNLIKGAQTKNPFKVVYVERPFTDDMEQDGTPVVKVRNFKKEMEKLVPPIKDLSQMRGVVFTKSGTNARNTMCGDATIPVKFCKPGASSVSLVDAVNKATTAFSDFLKIKQEKFDYVKSALKCVALPDNVKFYESIQGDGVKKEEEDEDSEDEDVKEDICWG